MYLSDCYSMRFTTLSNYYLINWWRNFYFCFFACWINFRFCYSYITWETGGLELASTIILLLQASHLTMCASHPPKIEYHYWILHIRISLGTKFQLQLISLTFSTKFAQKGYFRSKKVNMTIEFCMFELV